MAASRTSRPSLKDKSAAVDDAADRCMCDRLAAARDLEAASCAAAQQHPHVAAIAAPKMPSHHPIIGAK